MNKELKEFLLQFKNEIFKEMESQRNVTVSEIKETLTSVNEQLQKMNFQINRLDREVRKRNLIIFGVNNEFRDYWDQEEFVRQFLNEKLDLNLGVMDFDFIGRIGKYQENKARPILIGLSQFRTKLIILKNSSKLKGTNLSISEDFPKEVVEITRRYVPNCRRLDNQENTQ